MSGRRLSSLKSPDFVSILIMGMVRIWRNQHETMNPTGQMTLFKRVGLESGLRIIFTLYTFRFIANIYHFLIVADHVHPFMIGAQNMDVHSFRDWMLASSWLSLF